MNLMTTSQSASVALQEQAQALARQLGLIYVSRQKLSLPKLQEAYQADYILVYGTQGPVVYFGPGREHKFHLSMAQLRILRIQRGEGDHLLEAVGVTSQSVLDCTLGLGADAIVLSYGLGNHVRLVGLEASLPLWFVTSQGLASFEHENAEVTQALRRIQTHHANYRDFLASSLPGAFDTVYFDPMFEVPVQESPQFKPLRGHLLEEALTEESLQLAQRVAKQQVIVKERPFSSIFKKWPPSRLVGGKYSRVVYGVYDIR